MEEYRENVQWPISVWAPDKSRFFNGKTKDIGKLGTRISLMALPGTFELGEILEINIPRTKKLAEKKGGRYARIKQGKITTVEENCTEILIDVKFSDGTLD